MCDWQKTTWALPQKCDYGQQKNLKYLKDLKVERLSLQKQKKVEFKPFSAAILFLYFLFFYLPCSTVQY